MSPITADEATAEERQLSERSQRKREDILGAATDLFLENGYAATSMDEVAAAAKVSKQTVYKNFRNKESLFREMALSTVTTVGEPFQALVADVESGDDLAVALRALARRYMRAVMQPELLKRRQLIVREAGRFPDVARAYHEAAPRETVRHLAASFGRLAKKGSLSLTDPETAATHFAFLILGEPLDTVMFQGTEGLPTAAMLERMADAATDAFLAAYGSR